MSTYGYDYSFALSVDEVNKILKDNLQHIDLELTYTDHDTESGSLIRLNATMLPWQLIKGSQNSLLRFSIPLSKGNLNIEGPIPGNYDLANVTMLMEVTLGWLGTGSIQQATGSGDVTKLVFAPTQATDPNNPGYVSVVTILDPDNKLGTTGMGLLRHYIINALFENKDKINYIFANVFPRPNGVSSWLNPFKWVYYFSTGKTYDALCFLCMLSDKQLPPPNFDSTALTTNNNSTILIAQQVFFNQVVLPSVQKSFQYDGFSLSVNPNGTCTITNYGEFTLRTGKGTITAKSFTLTPSDSGNGLKTIASGGDSLKFFLGLAKLPDAYYTWSCQSTYPLQYANDKITFLPDNNPITHHEQNVPWYDWVLLVVLGITSIGEVASVIADCINGFYDEVNIIGIGNINVGLGNAVSGSVVNLANLINWSTTDGQKFEPATAGLNGALYVYGNLTNK